MENKNIKRQVKKLVQQKKYEDVYVIYGRKWFKKYVPKRYQKQDRKKLWREGKFLDIYNKYGKLIEEEVKEIDIEMETGKELAKRQKIKILCRETLNVALSTILVSVLGLSTAKKIIEGVYIDNQINKNHKKYEKEIEAYEKEIKTYAKNINQKNYTDLEIFIKLMKDIYQTTRGYGTPETDVKGYYGMDMQEGGIGVCRNIADNMADKLNEINPDYNARSIGVISNYSDIEYNNIIQKTNLDGGMLLINRGNEARLYDDSGELVKIATKESDREVIQKYENGKIVSKEISFQEDNVEIEETYEENRLTYRRISKDNEFIQEAYNEDGSKAWENISDKDKIVTMHYTDGELSTKVIEEEDKRTTFSYRNGEMIAKTEQESEEYYNCYLFNQKNKKEKDSIEAKRETTPNHVVVIADVEADNATIILDPTNCTIGTYKDGDIIMFNETEDKEPIKRTFTGDVLYSGTENFIEYPKEWIQSFLDPLISVEELEAKYGVEAQNKALAKIEKEDKKKSFKDEIKFEGQMTGNEIVYNVTEGKANIFGKDYDLTK